MKFRTSLLLFISVLSFFFLGFVFMTGCGTGGGGSVCPSAATTVWVDSQNGSDEAGNGSASKPYKTIAKALAYVQTDWTVFLKNSPVPYDGFTWPLYSDNITFKGESPEGVKIEGSSRVITVNSFPGVTTCNIEDLTIKDGSVADHGGGIYISGSGLTFNAVRVIFSSNETTSSNNEGGAVYVTGATFKAVSCTFEGNTAYENGGAVSNSSDGIFDIRRCFFVNNTAQRGGAVRSNGNGRIENSIMILNHATPYVGGAISHPPSAATLEVINCTIVSNESDNDGGGLRINRVDIKNCIIWGNSAVGSGNDVSPQTSDRPYIEYSDILEWPSISNNGPGTLEAVDPVFASFPPSKPSDLKLTGSSPLPVREGGTTAGAPPIDYEGGSRIPPFSMGAYEY